MNVVFGGLKAGWLEDTAQAHVYEDAQRCASLFREYCLQNNLLDFSLQVGLQVARVAVQAQPEHSNIDQVWRCRCA